MYSISFWCFLGQLFSSFKVLSDSVQMLYFECQILRYWDMKMIHCALLYTNSVRKNYTIKVYILYYMCLFVYVYVIMFVVMSTGNICSSKLMFASPRCICEHISNSQPYASCSDAEVVHERPLHCMQRQETCESLWSEISQKLVICLLMIYFLINNKFHGCL